MAEIILTDVCPKLDRVLLNRSESRGFSLIFKKNVLSADYLTGVVGELVDITKNGKLLAQPRLRSMTTNVFRAISSQDLDICPQPLSFKPDDKVTILVFIFGHI